MNNLALRAVSGTLYVALIICSLIFSDLLFCILCVIFGVLAIVKSHPSGCSPPMSTA